MNYKNIDVPISKTFEGVVYSIVAQPGIPDLQGDIWPADEIRKAAFNFMEQSRIFNREHTDEVLKSVSLVENWVTSDAGTLGDEEYLPGSWLIGIRINSPDLMDQILSGEYSAVSIEGTGMRT